MSGSATRFLFRLESYKKAFKRLSELVLYIRGEKASLFAFEESGIDEEILREALIKRFEFTQELSWKLLKDYLQYQGATDLMGSRDVYRRALNLGIISDSLWLNMILDRNLSAHDYNDDQAKEISRRIVELYFPLFEKLHSSALKLETSIPEEDK